MATSQVMAEKALENAFNSLSKNLDIEPWKLKRAASRAIFMLSEAKFLNMALEKAFRENPVMRDHFQNLAIQAMGDYYAKNSKEKAKQKVSKGSRQKSNSRK